MQETESCNCHTLSIRILDEWSNVMKEQTIKFMIFCHSLSTLLAGAATWMAFGLVHPADWMSGTCNVAVVGINLVFGVVCWRDLLAKKVQNAEIAEKSAL